MKAFVNYFWKTLTVTFVGIGLTVAFSASASADETVTDAAFEDQIDPALLEYLLMSDNFQDSDALTPEEENLREEAERAALDKALEGFEARKALIEEEFWHLEFDGGIKSWDKGVIYFTTTEAGFEHYSAKFKSMIDDGYLVIDATFDMHWPTENLGLSGVQPIELEIPVKHPEFGLDQKGLDTLLGLFESEMGAHLEFDGMVQKSRDDLFTLSTTKPGFEFFSIRFKRLVDAGLLVIDAKFDMGPISQEGLWDGKEVTLVEDSPTIEKDGEASTSAPTESILEDEREFSYLAVEPALTAQAEDSSDTWFAYGPEGTEKGIYWSRLYYQFALLTMLTLQQPGSSLGVVSDLSDSGQ